MQHPDEGLIHTWLDGQLPAEEVAALEAHVADCEQCRASVAEARGFIAASSRIVGTLDNVPGEVIPSAKPARRVWYSSPQFRAAAAVVVVAGASLVVLRTGTRKSTLSDSVRRDASEMVATQRVMSPMAPAVANSALVKPPVVADQVAAKVGAARRAEAPVPKGSSVLSARVPAPIIDNRVVVNEADFSGKGVKGGSASGVQTQAAELDTTATKKTTYQSLSGTDVVLTEELPTPVLSKAAASNDENRQRTVSGGSVVTGATAAAPAPAPAAQRVASIQTITWVDSLTRKRYTLSGRVSVEELEALKARLIKTKR